jgi:DNA-binding IclR family transcriptional regulator
MSGNIPQMLLSRVRSEYIEMPGLKLTPWQAAKLWGLEHSTSERLLAALVESGFLWRTRDGLYLRSSAR